MIGYFIAIIISASAGVLLMGAVRMKAFGELREERDRLLVARETDRRNYHDLDSRASNLAISVLILQKRIQRIIAIPNNGKKPNGGLLKAQRIAGGE